MKIKLSIANTKGKKREERERERLPNLEKSLLGGHDTVSLFFIFPNPKLIIHQIKKKFVTPTIIREFTQNQFLCKLIFCLIGMGIG